MILVRYAAGFCGAVVGLTVLVLTVIVMAVTLVESAGRLTRFGASGWATLELCAHTATVQAYQLLPIACFLGALVAGTLLARRGELLAIEAAGVGPARLRTAFLGVAALTAALQAGMGQWAVPRAVAGVERIEARQLRRVGALSRFFNRRDHYFREGEWILYLPVVDTTTETFRDAVIYRFVGGKILAVIEAARMSYSEGTWWLEDARSHTVGEGDRQELQRMKLGVTVRPRDLLDITGDPRQMGWSEVRALAARRTAAGFDATLHRLEFHSRAALPLSALAMCLFVLPWTLLPNRRRSLPVTLGAGVVAIAVLLSASHVFRLLALSDVIPVYLGAWGVNAAALTATPVSFLLARRRARLR